MLKQNRRLCTWTLTLLVAAVAVLLSDSGNLHRAFAAGWNASDTLRQESGGLHGYISMSVPVPAEEYQYGVSLYATAWPLLERPLDQFQIGLASIWIIPDNQEINDPLLPTGTVARDHMHERGPSYRDVFQTIEGGLGFWCSTRFGSATAKFRMNGTPDGYNHEIASPGWGFQHIEPLPPEEMGIAQLSPRLLVPPDGLTFRDGTRNELFGYAWMALPLIPAKVMTAGKPVPTGNQCWTLFLSAENFKGPLAFYTPSTWSRISLRHPPAIGRGLDARPGLVRGGAIEINTVPCFVARDKDGKTFTKIPRLQFPADKQGRTVLIHNLTHYSKNGLWRQTERWLEGGETASGRFDEKGTRIPRCRARPLRLDQGPDKVIQGYEQWVKTAVFNESTFGLQWRPEALEPWGKALQRGSLPRYYKLEKRQLAPVLADAVPDSTGLKQAQFRRAKNTHSYTSPDDPQSCWRTPGPKTGPFSAQLADGSVVTYYWYRFIDQPSLQNAGLTDTEKAKLQLIVENMHIHWTMNRDYLPPPGIGTLASLDSALLLTPPKGLEIGYVPIVTRQSPGK
jgi:hypothetical protein